MIGYQTERLTVREVDEHDEPEAFLALFNSNPSFIDANTLHTGVEAWELDDAERFLWQNTVMEDSHCLAVLDRRSRLVATVTLLVPHPREGQPWIGLLLVDGALDIDDYGGEVMEGLERQLAEQGWTSAFVSPLVELPQHVRFWQDRGYVPVEERLDNNSRIVLVHRKDLGP